MYKSIHGEVVEVIHRKIDRNQAPDTRYTNHYIKIIKDSRNIKQHQKTTQNNKSTINKQKNGNVLRQNSFVALQSQCTRKHVFKIF